MADLPALRAFLEGHDVPVPGDLSEADLTVVGLARDRLKEVFFAPDEDSAAALVNAILEDHGAVPRVEHEGGEFRLSFAPRQARIGVYLAITAAMGLAELMVESGRSRLGICSADECLDVYVDTSRNRSRRYCADACCTRKNVAAFRARRRTS